MSRSLSRRVLRTLLLCIGLFVVPVIVAPAAQAAVCDTTWNDAGGDDRWITGANWDNGVPQVGENACIPNGMSVTYDATTVTPANVTLGDDVQFTHSLGATLNMTGTLTLGSNTT